MNEIIEKAEIYTEENIMDVLKEAFSKVYADGYRDGYKDREEEFIIDLGTYETKYVDLGLPSCTLWSSEFEIKGDKIDYLSYDDAALYGIPTKEQFLELLELCEWKSEYITSTCVKFTCIGPNGNHIVFYSKGYKLAGIKHEPDRIFFWIQSITGKSIKEAGTLYHHKENLHIRQVKIVTEMFSGNMLPLRLVKNDQLTDRLNANMRSLISIPQDITEHCDEILTENLRDIK